MIYNKPRDISFRLFPSKTTKNRKKEKRKINKAHLIQSVTFFTVLLIVSAVSFVIPLRPTYSATEQRELTPFPEFSLKSVISGDYFDGISTWFSDTFPFREQLTKMNTSLKNLSGFDSIVIHGDTGSGDEIPDIPLDVPVTEDTETTEPPQTTLPPETLPPETTEPTSTVTPETSAEQTEPAPNIQTQSMGAILVAGNSAYEYYNFSGKLAPDFINSVNNIKNASGNKSNVYSLLIPTSIDIELPDAIRANINTSDQKKALDYFNSSFTNVTAVPGIYETQKAHRGEYTYFRTDHHWTALGAYYAYEQFAQSKGITPVPLSQYQTVSYDNFLGTFYSSSGQSEALGRTPDTVITYTPINNTDCTVTKSDGSSFKWNVISDVTNYDSNLKYLTFIGGDNALTTIENKDITEGETCIVIKESYGNAFVPFLIPHYKTIYVIDPRHYKGTLSEFTSDKNVDDIIFLANISTTRNEIYINAMKEFIR